MLKTTMSSLNHLLPRDLVSYVERGAVSALNRRAQLNPCCSDELSDADCRRMESFHDQVSMPVQQHRDVPSNLNDERQREAPPSGNKQSTAL